MWDESQVGLGGNVELTPTCGENTKRKDDTVSESSVSLRDYLGHEESAESIKLKQFELYDRALEQAGVGMFQYFILLLVGLGYFVEAAEISSTSALYPVFMKEWNAEETELAQIASLTSLGMLIGAVFMGWLSDIKGRKWVYQYSLLTSITFGFLSSYGTSPTSFAILRFFLGLGYGGNLVSTTPYLLEVTPAFYRGKITVFTSLYWAAGSFFLIGLSWGFMATIGWQWVVRITALIGVPVNIALFFVAPESIRFSVSSGNYAEACKGMAFLCRLNKVDMPEFFTEEKLRDLEYHDNVPVHSKSPLRCFSSFRCSTMLLKGRYLRIFVPLLSVWFLNSFAGAVHAFVPLMLKLEVGEEHGANIQYETMFAAQIGDFLGFFVLMVLYRDSSRLLLVLETRMGLFLQGATLFALALLSSNYGAVLVLIGLKSIGNSLIMHGLYTYSPQQFPTSVRVQAFSYCQLVHRLAPVISPFLLTNLDQHGTFTLTMVVYGCIFTVAILISFFLKAQTTNLSEYTNCDSELGEEESEGKQLTRKLSTNV